jgi:hypothetical protein
MFPAFEYFLLAVAVAVVALDTWRVDLVAAAVVVRPGTSY